MKANEGGTVYPHSLLRTGGDESDLNYISTGISRRDWLAGLAMQGLLASEGMAAEKVRITERSYEIADIMIANSLEDKKEE
ncbi:hypothetical protein [Nitrospina watsonii]|uniref:Uncharacterized protein n=1 Tax=Nitrospina watsonii TaxID=1323948 RepID=A0ABN8W4N5_9BACT|nr:hypothetical protein [Nitrospina watsonii]CAI2718601.1 conserved protein of unknown function [Nitrospina watsonii]